jgi:hypothetical protein
MTSSGLIISRDDAVLAVIAAEFWCCMLRCMTPCHIVPCCAVLCCAEQYGQSNFFKLPGGKLKPDEDGKQQ